MIAVVAVGLMLEKSHNWDKTAARAEALRSRYNQYDANVPAASNAPPSKVTVSKRESVAYSSSCDP